MQELLSPLSKRLAGQRLARVVAVMMFAMVVTARGQGGTLDFGFSALVHGAPIHRRAPLAGGDVDLTRCDLLLSGLEIKTASGEWLASRDWFAFLSLDAKRAKSQATGLPPGEVTAIRFQVGLPASINAADPSGWEVGHVLHPEVNGLHWSWQGGYIFGAIEGHYWSKKDKDQAPGGFAFHYARSENAVAVELPVEFRSGGPVTLMLELDLSVLLGGVDLQAGATSTHSRPGDPVSDAMKSRWASAFRIGAVHYDQLQPVVTPASAMLPAHATPLPLAVTQRFPQMPLPADNPLTVEGVSLGERLFHETRLSNNSTQACASCHQQSAAFSDTRRVSLGAEGQKGKRQSMALFNLAWHQSFFWDGRAATLREQVLMPITDSNEMNASLDLVVSRLRDDQTYRAQFKSAFADGDISPDMIAKALEQYLLTLIAQDSKFDRALRKLTKLSPSEARGLQLFVTEHDPVRGLRGADCFHCHGGMLFTDNGFHNNGLSLKSGDTGRGGVTGVAADLGKFKTPSLRNIALTAPYMHDGRFATLEEVVDHYSSGVQRSETLDPNLAKHPAAGLQLTADEKADLVAFLKTLTDEPTPTPRELTAAHP
jgi:cytochrome c peroxidase